MITTPHTPPWTIDTPHPACFIAATKKHRAIITNWCRTERSEYGKHNTMQVIFHQRPNIYMALSSTASKSVASFSLN